MATISYDEFGRRFIEQVITADRVEHTLEGVVAGSFDTEVRMAGGLVRARGEGRVSDVAVDRVDSDALAFRALLHVSLSLVLKVSGVPYRYEGAGRIVLELHASAQDDLSIFVQIPDVTTADIELDLQPVGRVAAILDQLGGVNDQVRREIARFVNIRKDEPGALEQRRIDVAGTIEHEWERRTKSG